LQNYSKFGRFLEEFTVGQIIQHKTTKKITEEDNKTFCILTHNNHPLHLDDEYAKNTMFKKKVAVGTYIVSLVVGLSVEDISGKAIANLDYEKIIHHAPVFFGDVIRVETKILKKRDSKTKLDRGIVYVESLAYNQDNVKVLTLRRHILIPKKYKHD
jgi:acyl dehydratase